MTPFRLLIAGLHPRLLEKPAVWFEKHAREIINARHLNAFWRNHTNIIEEGISVKISELARIFTDLGYVKLAGEEQPVRGTFLLRGGEFIIFPINTKQAYRIEFLGNCIEHVEPFSKQSAETDENTAKFLTANALASLCHGDFVVHIDHGIGIYRGVVSLPVMNQALHDKPKTELPIRGCTGMKLDLKQHYLAIEYAKPRKNAPPDMLYVPEYQIKRVSPYLGFRTPAVHRLGTMLWNTTKRKAKEDIIAFAKELLSAYAAREIAARPAYESLPLLETELANSFPFEETAGQRNALEEIFSDMAQSKPMDRLLCADVGFGKTEVALRAAFRAVCNKRQVALICPTTVLAAQHYATFEERLRTLPVTTARLSRLESKTQQREILQRAAAGAIDIIIGTHRLISRDVTFQNLGLLIIDEEQRFGVRQKEHMRTLRSATDTLSLSATPIPRTMHLALANLRRSSIITTPPPLRLAPKTFVLPFSKKTIQQAIEAEIARGGQVYVLSNHIRKLPLAEEFIRNAVPHARISIIHGRMKEADIVKVMQNFRARKSDVLLATTIIENGLDIANANTIIVEDATRIGLSQAHQLRGRIGRGIVQSYAYFLYPRQCTRGGSGHLKEKAARRLTVLLHTQQLGQGHEIALRDMEIRGAGNIIGRDQSGRVNQIGLNLYCQMLAEAVEQIQNVKIKMQNDNVKC